MGTNLDGFLSLVFFSFGFLSLVFVLGIFLNLFLKLRLYTFYSFYSLSILIFIGLAFAEEIKMFQEERLYVLACIDIIQVFSNLFYCIFLYETLVNFDKKHKKLYFLVQLFLIFVVFHVGIAIFFFNFFVASFNYFLISRVIIYIISFTFYIVIFKNIRHTYFKFLFAAATILYCSGFVALYESMITIRNNHAFLYLCIGFFLENNAFLGFIIYNYFNEKQLKMKNEVAFQKELLAQSIEIQMQTMQQIGRDIHDNIGQKLTLASLYSQQLIWEKNSTELPKKIETIAEIINSSLSELRQLSKSLIDDTVEEQTIGILIEKECAKINVLKKCAVFFNFSNDDEIHLDYTKKVMLLRITQEFLQNSIKHSKCKNINISLVIQTHFCELHLQDDGIGFEKKPKQTNGFGLINMKKRTELINGSFELKTNPEQGTSIKIKIPF